MMVPLLFTSLLAAAAAGGDPAVVQVDGLRFGPSRRLSGLYYTILGSGRFECDNRECQDLGDPYQGDMNVHCQLAACAELEARFGRLNGGGRITFIGRRGTQRHQPRFLGDSERDVLIERILDFRKGGDPAPSK